MNSTKGNILLTEDEPTLHETIKMNLELEGYSVTSAFNGSQAINAIDGEHFNLIILDIMLPEMDGLLITERIRIQNITVPILILSARDSSSDRVLGLKKGADDYLTKPFNLEELLLRVDKLIDKNKLLEQIKPPMDEYQFGGCSINFNAQTAIDVNGHQIELSKKESMLLKLLLENKNEVVTREKILQVVWGYNVFPNTRTIDNFILSFRKYFESDSRQPQHFQSVRGVGYKYVE